MLCALYSLFDAIVLQSWVKGQVDYTTIDKGMNSPIPLWRHTGITPKPLLVEIYFIPQGFQERNLLSHFIFYVPDINLGYYELVPAVIKWTSVSLLDCSRKMVKRMLSFDFLSKAILASEKQALLCSGQ